jgi:Domain of unknown function (DUF4189)
MTDQGSISASAPARLHKCRRRDTVGQSFCAIKTGKAGGILMQRVIVIAMGTAAVVSVLASSGPASAQYGAIAFDQNNCAWGRAWNFQTAPLAAAAALTECGRPGCKVIVEIPPRACGSLSSTANCKGWGAATRPTLAEAQKAGLELCANANTGMECIARVGDCNK